MNETYALDSIPEHAMRRGDSPIELQIVAAMKIPVELFLMVASWQQAPIIRTNVKIVRKMNPPELRTPWR